MKIMKIKERCIYYNNARGTYYLVLSAKKEKGLIFGIYGEIKKHGTLQYEYKIQDGLLLFACGAS